MAKSTSFRGFEPITANFIYCPNQFFDVCLPHYDRGVVRLVAYMLRQTLGFRDKQGNPINTDISISYGDFINAGISRGSIRSTVEKAIAGGFIQCVQQGTAKSKNRPSQTARYTLRWGKAEEYVADPRKFDGFYTGEGCRSPIPNGFFDHVAPHETLAVVKVVGTVLRFTVGYENQFGRRDQFPLSYSHIQRYARMGDRKTLASAIRLAIAAGYICCVDAGRFDHRSSNRKAATYAIHWLEQAASRTIGSKSPPAVADRFKNPTSNGSKTQPADRSKNATSTKRNRKSTLKQQRGKGGVPSAAEHSKAHELLRTEGFDGRTATKLSEQPLDVIERQVAWIDWRSPENRLGMLRRAIEEDWPEPTSVMQRKRQRQTHEQQQRRDAEQAASEAVVDEQIRRHNEQRKALLSHWRERSAEQQRRYHARAIQNAKSKTDRLLLRRASLESPPTAVLETMAIDLGISIGESS